MYVWMDGWMDGRTDGWMDGWMHPHGWMDGWMDGWLDGWMDASGWMDGWTDGWLDGWMHPDGCIRMDGWMYVWSRVPCSRERELGGPYHWGGARVLQNHNYSMQSYLQHVADGASWVPSAPRPSSLHLSCNVQSPITRGLKEKTNKYKVVPHS